MIRSWKIDDVLSDIKKKLSLLWKTTWFGVGGLNRAKSVISSGLWRTLSINVLRGVDLSRISLYFLLHIYGCLFALPAVWMFCQRKAGEWSRRWGLDPAGFCSGLSLSSGCLCLSVIRTHAHAHTHLRAFSKPRFSWSCLSLTPWESMVFPPKILSSSPPPFAVWRTRFFSALFIEGKNNQEGGSCWGRCSAWSV